MATFTSAWMAGEVRATALLPDAFRDAAARARAVAAATRPVSPALVEALPQRTVAATRNLERLAQPGSAAVVTGQQAGLFLGPLFTLYKAASAIAVARALEGETGRPCVPVFWLQSEDHDVPEIDVSVVPRSTGQPLRLSMGLTPGRVSVSHVRVPETSGLLEALRAELGAHPHAAAHLALLERAWRPGASLADAFADALAAVLDELVILDPRAPGLAALAAPVHRRAIDEAPVIADALARRVAALEAVGFEAQVHVRPGAPLSFYAPDGAGGPRYRLEPMSGDADDRFALVGDPRERRVTRADLHAALETDPARFTTSALLRPALQDTWLPTAAYVAGPGEVAYFAQIPSLFEHFGLPQPLVVPRARFRVVDDRADALLEKLGLTPDEAALSREALLARVARGGDGFEAPADLEARLLAPFEAALGPLGESAAALDPHLTRAVERTADTVRDAVQKLVGKYGRALAARDGVAAERIDRLRAALAPDGEPQERVHGLTYFACRYGARAFADRVLAAIDPFAGDLQDLRP